MNNIDYGKCPASIHQMIFLNEQTKPYGTKYLLPKNEMPCIYEYFCDNKSCSFYHDNIFGKRVYPYEREELFSNLPDEVRDEVLKKAEIMQQYYGILFPNESIDDEKKKKLTIELIKYAWDNNRTLYTREYERIIFTNIFRRLQYKTQVMVNSASDDQRTRLLHSLEVQKIAKKIAVGVGANWELAETIAIAHDIGHSPFGHAGESAIDHYLRDHDWGAFSHALQGVKVLQELISHPVLERCGIHGLGLSEFVLEGVLKHDADSFTDGMLERAYKLQFDSEFICAPTGIENPDDYKKKINEYIKSLKITNEKTLPQVWIGSIESQIVAWADKVAYLGSDWEEFISTGLLEEMMSRINDMVLEIESIAKQFTEETDSGHEVKDQEAYCINEIWNSLVEINKAYSNLKSGDDTSLRQCWGKVEPKVHIIIENVLKIESMSPETMQSDVDGKTVYKCNKYFTAREYRALRNYFVLTESWVRLLELYPRTYGLKNDPIYIFYQYLVRIRPNVIAPIVVNFIINGTNEFAASLSADKWGRDDYLLYCNKKWVYKYNKVRKEYHTEKEQRKLLKKTVRSCYIVGFHTVLENKFIEDCDDYLVGVKNDDITSINEWIGRYNFNLKYNCMLYVFDFIGDEFIGSSRVKFMKHTAQEIITKLMDYYVTHPDMLPFNQRKEYNKKQYDLAQEWRIPEVTEEEYNAEFKAIRARSVADYVASMTDRMAKLKYDEIVSSETRWSDAFEGEIL